MKEKLPFLEKEVASIETLKTDFIANVLHEMKTPLALIQSYAYALKKESISKEVKEEYLNTIMEVSKKLSTLVKDILCLNKLEHQESIKNSKFTLDEQIRFC